MCASCDDSIERIRKSILLCVNLLTWTDNKYHDKNPRLKSSYSPKKTKENLSTDNESGRQLYKCLFRSRSPQSQTLNESLEKLSVTIVALKRAEQSLINQNVSVA